MIANIQQSSNKLFMEEYLIISNSSKLHRMAHDSIVYVKGDGNYSTFYLSDGSAIQDVVMQLGHVEKLIELQLKQNGYKFIRLGKSHIINTQFVKSIETGVGTLTMFCYSNLLKPEIYADKITDFSELKSHNPAIKAIPHDYKVKIEYKTIEIKASSEALRRLKEQIEKLYSI